jgi:hypothetical protein
MYVGRASKGNGDSVFFVLLQSPLSLAYIAAQNGVCCTLNQIQVICEQIVEVCMGLCAHTTRGLMRLGLLSSPHSLVRDGKIKMESLTECE